MSSKPDTALRTVPVYRPSIGTNDSLRVYNENLFRFVRHFNGLAATGELPQPSTPAGLQNISYTLDLNIPIVRCEVSNDAVRTQIAASAFEANTQAGPYAEIADFTSPTRNAQDLTSTRIGQLHKYYNGHPPGANVTWRQQYNYYAMLGNTSDADDTRTAFDLWLAISTGSKSSVANIVPETDYYTCSVRNASLTTSLAFIDSPSSISIGAVKEQAYSGVQNSSYGQIAKSSGVITYGMFGYWLYNLLLGSVTTSVLSFDSNHGSSEEFSTYPNTTADQTIFAAASDFAGMISNQGYPQNHNLTTLIEDFSVNASLGLMSIPSLW